MGLGGLDNEALNNAPASNTQPSSNLTPLDNGVADFQQSQTDPMSQLDPLPPNQPSWRYSTQLLPSPQPSQSLQAAHMQPTA